MTIKFRSASQDDDGSYFFQIYGPQTTTGNVAIAAVETPSDPQTWIDANPAEAQALIDASTVTGTALCRLEELEIFLENTPIARALSTAHYNNLLSAIAARTANQETIFLQLLALRVRASIAESAEQ